MLLHFHWLLGLPLLVCLLLLSQLNGTCTFLGAAALREPAELINNLLPCQAERAVSLALARQSCPFLWGEPLSSQSPPHPLQSQRSTNPSDETSGLAGKGSCLALPAREGLKQTNASWHLSRLRCPGRLMESQWRGRGPAPAKGFGVHISAGDHLRAQPLLGQSAHRISGISVVFFQESELLSYLVWLHRAPAPCVSVVGYILGDGGNLCAASVRSGDGKL